jgi:adenine phosphoribosyltransferase
LFGNPEAHRKLIDLFSDYISTIEVDVIVGLEARGFILGSAIAYKLNIPFVPIRKKGKLPGKTVAYKYDLEYGSDIVELQEGVIKSGQKVVIVDDLIATGGTCAAAVELLKKVEADIVEALFLVEFTDLPWKNKVHIKTKSFIAIDSSS